MLNSFPVSEWNGGKVHHIIGSVYHLMRGQIFNIDGLRIFTMGGGESPDVDIRIANDTWYPEESPSQQELIEGAENMATYNNIVEYGAAAAMRIWKAEHANNVQAELQRRQAGPAPMRPTSGRSQQSGPVDFTKLSTEQFRRIEEQVKNAEMEGRTVRFS